MAVRPASQNPILSLVVVHSAIGFAGAAVLVAGIVVANPNELGVLLRQTPLAAAMLWFFSGLTFASVQTGAAVMALADRD